MGRLRLKGDGLSHLSPSGTSVLMACEQQYVARYGPERLFDPPTEATAMGSGFAWALETGSVEAGVAEYLRCRPEGDPVLDDPEVRIRQAVIAESIIRHAFTAYHQRFGWDEVVEREVTYLTRLPGEEPLNPVTGQPLPGAAPSRRLLQVRVDGVGQGYLVEDKLRAGASLQPADLENEIRQGRQLTAEIWSHLHHTGELLPVSFRQVRKPDPRPLKAAPLEDIDALVAAHFEQEKAVAVYEVRRTEAQLDQWLEEQRALAARADALLAGRAVPVRNTSACHAYGRTCPRLAACQGMA